MGVQAPKAPAKAEKAEDTVRAIESSAARVQPESPVRIDLADQDDKAFPAQRKLDNTQTFSL
jgi:hypothetical protein